MELKDLGLKIEILRKQLNLLVDEKKYNLTDPKVVELSTKLDILINEYNLKKNMKPTAKWQSAEA